MQPHGSQAVGQRRGRPVPNSDQPPPDDDRGAGAGAPRDDIDLVAEIRSIGGALNYRGIMERLEPAAYYSPKHRIVAEALAAHAADPVPPSAVQLAAEIDEAGHADVCGGFVGLRADLIAWHAETDPEATSALHVERVHELAARRRNVGVVADLRGAATGPSGDFVAKLTEHAEQAAVTRAVDRNLDPFGLANLGALVDGNIPDTVPGILFRDDGQGLLYPARMSAVYAEPAAGKSWLALIAAVGVLEVGGTVLYLDYEGHARTALARLLALGQSTGAILDRFHYAQPDRIGPGGARYLTRRLAASNPDLVVIDGVARSLVAQGLSEDQAPDFMAWSEMLPRAITATGAAVLLLDHVVKDREQQGRWARGSGAKLAEVDGVAYTLRVDQPVSRGGPGKVVLHVVKDREGLIGVAGADAAAILTDPGPDPGRLRVRVVVPFPKLAGAAIEAGDTLTADFVARVVDAVNTAHVEPDAPGPTRNAIEDELVAGGLRFDRKKVSPALRRLEREGKVQRKPHRTQRGDYWFPAPPPAAETTLPGMDP